MIDPLDHLFRRESGRIVATLVRILGVHHLALAEDVVQEAFCRALEVWKFRGMPRNAPAWLMITAKNCALDALRRQRTARTAAPELANALQSEWTLASTVEEQFGSQEIKDDLLRMMFSCLPSAPAGDRADRLDPAHPVRLQCARGRKRFSKREGRNGEADRPSEEGTGAV